MYITNLKNFNPESCILIVGNVITSVY